MEAALSVTEAEFVQEEEKRLAEGDFRLKFKLYEQGPQSYYLYYKYREAQGEPISRFDFEVDGVMKVVSPYADQGKDHALGFLVRSPLFWRMEYHLGGEFKQGGNRRFEDYAPEEKILSAFFALQRHFFSKKLMLALENHYVYWLDRGDYWKIIPQLRWEFINDWIIEAGISRQMIGGGQEVGIVGVTYEYD